MGKMNNIIMSTSTTNENKIYPQNQVILHFFLCQAQVCKYHSDTGHCLTFISRKILFLLF